MTQCQPIEPCRPGKLALEMLITPPAAFVTTFEAMVATRSKFGRRVQSRDMRFKVGDDEAESSFLIARWPSSVARSYAARQVFLLTENAKDRRAAIITVHEQGWHGSHHYSVQTDSTPSRSSDLLPDGYVVPSKSGRANCAISHDCMTKRGGVQKARKEEAGAGAEVGFNFGGRIPHDRAVRRPRGRWPN